MELHQDAIRLHENLPMCEVVYLLETTSGKKLVDSKMTDEEKLAAVATNVDPMEVLKAKVLLTNNRLMNAACSVCASKNTNIRCEKCGTTFWCSEKCKTEHAETHAGWCMKPYGVRDTGPMRTAFLRIKSPTLYLKLVFVIKRHFSYLDLQSHQFESYSHRRS